MTNLRITYTPLSDLRPDPNNARLHKARQISKIARSIKQFGFNNPILIDAEKSILCGHGRYRAAQQLGLAEVPVVYLDHLNAAEKRAYMLADNRIAEDAGWEPAILAAELENLIALEPAFEITDTGFEMAEVDMILSPPDGDDDAGDPEDAVVSPDLMARVSRPGDLWQIGDHRIFCGDALDRSSYQVLLGDERAAMVFTDPPYNRPVNAIANSGRTRHGEFVEASGEMSSEAFQAFLTTAFQRMAEFSTNGSLHFVCMDWRGLRELLAAGDVAFTEFKNLAVWVKNNGGMGSLYRSQHELVAIFKSGTGRHINNINLGASGRNRTNVWFARGNSSFHRGRDTEIALHPTVKTIALCADAMLDCSLRGSLILDPFGGSGTSLLAAHRCGRRTRLIERDPHYVDVALYRARTLLGLPAVNLWTGVQLEPLGMPNKTRPNRDVVREAARG